MPRCYAPDPRGRLDRQLASRDGDARRPSYHRGWTDDIYTRSLRAARLVQRAGVAATGAADNGLAGRSDLTGFNWANVPAILVETGFMSEPAGAAPPAVEPVPVAPRARLHRRVAALHPSAVTGSDPPKISAESVTELRRRRPLTAVPSQTALGSSHKLVTGLTPGLLG